MRGGRSDSCGDQGTRLSGPGRAGDPLFLEDLGRFYFGNEEGRLRRLMHRVSLPDLDFARARGHSFVR